MTLFTRDSIVAIKINTNRDIKDENTSCNLGPNPKPIKGLYPNVKLEISIH